MTIAVSPLFLIIWLALLIGLFAAAAALYDNTPMTALRAAQIDGR